MKKIIYILAAALTVFAVSCSKDPGSGEQGGGDKTKPVTKTISATLPAVKAALSGETVTWESSDAISVFDGKSNNKFTMVSGTMSGAKAAFYLLGQIGQEPGPEVV